MQLGRVSHGCLRCRTSLCIITHSTAIIRIKTDSFVGAGRNLRPLFAPRNAPTSRSDLYYSMTVRGLFCDCVARRLCIPRTRSLAWATPCHAGMVMFPDKDGNPWTPPSQPAPALHADNPRHVGNAPSASGEQVRRSTDFMALDFLTSRDKFTYMQMCTFIGTQAIATGFLPLDDPGRRLSRYEVPPDMWKYWGAEIRGGQPRM